MRPLFEDIMTGEQTFLLPTVYKQGYNTSDSSWNTGEETLIETKHESRVDRYKSRTPAVSVSFRCGPAEEYGRLIVA